jgi:hypothetical protein
VKPVAKRVTVTLKWLDSATTIKVLAGYLQRNPSALLAGNR